ncbi:Segregation and condensation protein B [Piscirickettsia salmonis]|uniref:Chromosome segregation/condensation protein ScpB n=1 Tax=Piscirickettsia salmonis TaxID=1238 RepID=A0A1L6T9E3_PISSA|nr:SMC-Scp complex subunit ScpB [Piscirickettsia salmonis]AKP73123.1 segregation and condensation protein B [Piscirickettsia salmonis LF-89 = ATCC VR-1361]ALB21780.1 chromosome segregation/condensation protein ScpB [Piscirickettsia salmonis]ALY01965.1 segregation and condensation protein B [Piscirickettsia salmonis]AMA41474.1 segregation and condensation protein B [Piscirickettsia salmonis]AOS33961.1 segregation and condensation protein B [Piscirickettsia salmonis]
MQNEPLIRIIEAALFSAARSLSLVELKNLFPEDQQPADNDIRAVLVELSAQWQASSIELCESAMGFRIQAKALYSPWVSRLWEEKPQRYSRALLETLALIIYRQPVTRAEIEEVRGVAVSTNIMRTLIDHEWVRVVGHREVPGRPAMYATTKQLLEHFGMKSLDEMPTLAEIRDLEDVAKRHELTLPGIETEREALRAQTKQEQEQPELLIEDEQD